MFLFDVRLQNPLPFGGKVALRTFELPASLVHVLDVGPQLHKVGALELALLEGHGGLGVG